MKNVTITLEEELASRARIAAAKEGKSLSRFLAGLVEQRVGRKRTQLEALEAFLAGPSLPLSGESGRLPTREELYDDALLRRHEHPDLHQRPKRQRKTATRNTMANRAGKT